MDEYLHRRCQSSIQYGREGPAPSTSWKYRTAQMGEGMLGFGAAEGQALALSSLSFKPAFFVPEAATHPPPAQWCTLASTATVSDSMHLSNQHYFSCF